MLAGIQAEEEFNMQLLQLAPAATGTTPVLARSASIFTPTVPFQWVTVQNNGTNPMRVGDATATATRGILLPPTSSITFGPAQHEGQNLNEWYVYIVSGDKCDIMYQE
jgi:hypothetical protein